MTDAAPTSPPLSEAHLAQLAHARRESRRLRRTSSIARASAWTTGGLGSLTLLGVLFGDLTSLVLGSALILIGVREGRLAGRLTRLDRRAPVALAVNQLILGAVLVAYSLWQTLAALASNGLSSSSQPIGDPQVDAMLMDIGRSTKIITVAFYVCVGLIGAGATALMSLYYYRKRVLLNAFISGTPEWVVKVMRTAA